MRIPRATALSLLLPLLACAAPARPSGTPSASARGAQILQRACTTCHGLDEITKFSGYYAEDDWRDVVATMIEYGAELTDRESEVLVDYLTRSYGKP
jgi:mono/diheme cytochrome c family protein